MARIARPWRRGGGAWYAQIDGLKVWLAAKEATKTQAQTELTRLLATQPGKRVRTRSLTVAEAFNLHVAFCREEVDRGIRSREACDRKEWLLTSAMLAFGSTPAIALKAHQVLSWTAAPKGSGKPWGVSTRGLAMRNVKAAFAWAERVGHIAENPIRDLVAPATLVRTAIPTDDVWTKLLNACAGPFYDLLTAIQETGCRPKEVWTLTADRVDLQARTWAVLNKTARKTGETVRTVYLTEPVVEMSRRLCLKWPEGPIFRNQYGRPWSRNTIDRRIYLLRERLGLDRTVIAYALRHSFATQALVRGVPIATVAALMGHKGTEIIARVYSKIARESDHLRAAVEQARAIRTDVEPVVDDASQPTPPKSAGRGRGRQPGS